MLGSEQKVRLMFSADRNDNPALEFSRERFKLLREKVKEEKKRRVALEDELKQIVGK